MKWSPTIIFKSKLIYPNSDLFCQILLHLFLWYDLSLSISWPIFDFFIALLDPLSISVFKEINQIFQDVQSLKENTLMNQSITMLINTVLKLIYLLKLQTWTYLHKCIMRLLPTVHFIVDKVSKLCLFHMEYLEFLLLFHHQLLHHHLLLGLLVLNLLHLLYLLILNDCRFVRALVCTHWNLTGSVKVVDWSCFYLIR